MKIDKELRVELSKNEKVSDGILAVIALKGPKCYDDLYHSPPRGIGLKRKLKEREELGSRSSVSYALQQLLKCKLIKLYKVIGGKKLYDLTLSGLLVALSLEPLLDHIDKVAKHHAHKLPLILGKWNLFVDVKADSIVKKRLKEYLSRPPEIVHISPYHYLIYGLEKGSKEEKEKFMGQLINEKFERRLQEDINRAVLFPWVFGIVYDFYVPNFKIPADKEKTIRTKITDDIEKWISIMLLDEELKAYLIGELNHLKKYGDFCSKVAKIYKHVIEKYPLYWYSKEK